MSAPGDSYLAEIAKLRAENELLRAEVYALKDDLRAARGERGEVWQRLTRALKLTPSRARLLAMLMASPTGYSSKRALYVAIWEAKGSSAAEKIVDVQLVHLRKTLRPLGLDVETIWGGQLFLPTHVKAELTRLAEAVQ